MKPVRVLIEGSLEFDPAKEELAERIGEILEDEPDKDEDEARFEAVVSIVHERLGHTVCDFDITEYR